MAESRDRPGNDLASDSRSDAKIQPLSKRGFLFHESLTKVFCEQFLVGMSRSQ